tara:strand:- start:2326 stop:2790 length:465 start_codon:yes stop_codon:yes gene_type:complete
MTVTYEEIVSILELAQASSCEELHIEIGDFKLIYKQPSTSRKQERESDSSNVESMPAPHSPEEINDSVTNIVPVGGVAVTSPMVGTFYRSPSPGAEPFVQEGSLVDTDTVVCIIEVMKVMNPIKAGKAGRIAHVAVDDGAAVEFGEILMSIELS